MTEVSTILGKRHVIVDFIYDLWNKPSVDVFNTYASYFEDRDVLIKRGLFFVIKHLKYNRENDQYWTSPLYDSGWSVYQGSNPYKITPLNDILDPRWYKVIANYSTNKKRGKHAHQDITTIEMKYIPNRPFTVCQYDLSFYNINHTFEDVLAIMNPNHTQEVQELMNYFMKSRTAHWIGRWEGHQNHVFWLQVKDEIIQNEEKLKALKAESKNK